MSLMANKPSLRRARVSFVIYSARMQVHAGVVQPTCRCFFRTVCCKSYVPNKIYLAGLDMSLDTFESNVSLSTRSPKSVAEGSNLGTPMGPKVQYSRIYR